MQLNTKVSKLSAFIKQHSDISRMQNSSFEFNTFKRTDKLAQSKLTGAPVKTSPFLYNSSNGTNSISKFVSI